MSKELYPAEYKERIADFLEDLIERLQLELEYANDEK